MAASLTGALKSAIALGGANADLLSDNGDPMIDYTPQPKLVEQLGWDEPDIKVMKRANFDDGTSVWGDPIELASAAVKKWTNGTKAALTNSTNTISQQQPPLAASMAQKPSASNVQPLHTSSSASHMALNDENWPSKQSPTLAQPSASQWTNAPIGSDQGTLSASSQQQAQQQQQQPPSNYRAQQSAGSNWNSQAQHGGQSGSDDWCRDGMVDTSDWGLQVRVRAAVTRKRS